MRINLPGWMPVFLPAALLVLAAGCAGGMEPKTIANSPDFQKEAIEATEPVVMVEFYETLCPACVQLAPTFAELAGEYQGRAKFIKVESRQADLMAQYRIQAFPTVVLLFRGRERTRWINEQNKGPYRQAINEALRQAQLAPAPAP